MKSVRAYLRSADGQVAIHDVIEDGGAYRTVHNVPLTPTDITQDMRGWPDSRTRVYYPVECGMVIKSEEYLIPEK